MTAMKRLSAIAEMPVVILSHKRGSIAAVASAPSPRGDLMPSTC